MSAYDVLGSMTDASHSHASHQKPLRKDAAANRQLILESAKRIFAKRGFSATLHDIARDAGIGVGTVYRRFANKQELMLEIYEEQIEELVEILKVALALEDPWECLVYYLENSTRVQVRDRGMAQLISGHEMGARAFDSAKNRIAPLVNQVVARGVDTGVLREDARGTDLVFPQYGLTSVAQLVETSSAPNIAQAKSLYRRYLWLALESLRRHHPDDLPLPIPALSTDETHAIFSFRS